MRVAELANHANGFTLSKVFQIELNVVGSVGAKITESRTASCELANPQVNLQVQGEEMGKDVEVVQLLQQMRPLLPVWVAKLELQPR